EGNFSRSINNRLASLVDWLDYKTNEASSNQPRHSSYSTYLTYAFSRGVSPPRMRGSLCGVFG
ncbi:MAG: hypothetical protein KAW12_26620, partial [Candidatus Aminicenantes bacterium]|nr:hypothetical protein [Candidatus Aminicenantes bacterium]